VSHWSFDPVVVVLAFTALAHEVGLARLARRSRATATVSRRRRSILFYAGLVALALAIVSPLDYWSSDYFYVHMIDHLVLAFLAPVLVVAGAPWIPLLFFLPVGARRRLGRAVLLGPRYAWLRSIGRAVRHPLTAVVAFNVVMVGWHLPPVFDTAESNQLVHVWLMHTSYMVTGVLFWLQFIPSRPMRPLRSPIWQAGSLLVTNLVMTLLAMSMSLLSSASWYSVYAHVPGVTLSPYADQQIGAAILWVCGDFWALPALLIVVRKAIEAEGSLAELVERVFRRDADSLRLPG
jgi:putative membrane protein